MVLAYLSFIVPEGSLFYILASVLAIRIHFPSDIVFVALLQTSFK